MKTLSNVVTPRRSLRVMARAGIGLAAGLFAASAVQAKTVDIEVWHTLSGANAQSFSDMVRDYNRSQSDVHVDLKAFSSPAQLEANALSDLPKGKGPNLLELPDNHSPEVVAESRYITPLYELLRRYPIKDVRWFLPDTASFVRDNKGRLLAFPWMAEIPIMYYNLNAFKAAGLNPSQPPRTWADMQSDLLALRDKANLSCPYGTSEQVEIHLENLAPVNNESYLDNDNGMVARHPAESIALDTLYIRHFALMASWYTSGLLVTHSAGEEANAAFANGQCGVLTASSSALGQFQHTASLKFGVAPLPYYPQETSRPGRPFVSGAALWAVSHKPTDEDKATADFLSWLAKPVNAAKWSQNTGYLPLTGAAFEESNVSYYRSISGLQELVDEMRTAPVSTGRGFRINNYPTINIMLNNMFDNVITGKTPPVVGLSNAATETRRISAGR